MQQHLDALGSDDPQIRRAAILALAKSGDESALPHLAKVVKSDPDPELRDLALKAGRHIKRTTAEQAEALLAPTLDELVTTAIPPKPTTFVHAPESVAQPKTSTFVHAPEPVVVRRPEPIKLAPLARETTAQAARSEKILLGLRVLVAVLIVVGGFMVARTRAIESAKVTQECFCGHDSDALFEDDLGGYGTKNAVRWLVLYIPLALLVLVLPLGAEFVAALSANIIVGVAVALKRDASDPVEEFLASSMWNFTALNIGICVVAGLLSFFRIVHTDAVSTFYYQRVEGSPLLDLVAFAGLLMGVYSIGAWVFPICGIPLALFGILVSWGGISSKQEQLGRIGRKLSVIGLGLGVGFFVLNLVVVVLIGL